jgi:hypothetical protein
MELPLFHPPLPTAGLAWTCRVPLWCVRVCVVVREALRYGYSSDVARSVVTNVTGSWAWTDTGDLPQSLITSISGVTSLDLVTGNSAQFCEQVADFNVTLVSRDVAPFWDSDTNTLLNAWGDLPMVNCRGVRMPNAWPRRVTGLTLFSIDWPRSLLFDLMSCVPQSQAVVLHEIELHFLIVGGATEGDPFDSNIQSIQIDGGAVANVYASVVVSSGARPHGVVRATYVCWVYAWGVCVGCMRGVYA